MVVAIFVKVVCTLISRNGAAEDRMVKTRDRLNCLASREFSELSLLHYSPVWFP